MTTILSEHHVLVDTPALAIDSAGTTTAVTGTFSLPTDFVDTPLVNQPVLSIVIDTSPSGGVLTDLEIEIRSSDANDFVTVGAFVVEATATFNSDVAETLHTVVNTNSLDDASTDNNFQFAITGGTGQAAISDVVLLIKRSVADPVNSIVGA